MREGSGSTVVATIYIYWGRGGGCTLHNALIGPHWFYGKGGGVQHGNQETVNGGGIRKQ